MATDANTWTVVALKEQLRDLGLSTYGNKAELILRLNRAGIMGREMQSIPSRADDGPEEMMNEIEALQDISMDGQERQSLNDRAPMREQHNVSEMELHLVRRENDLMQRELELMRRENEFLRLTNQQNAGIAATPPGQSIERIPTINLTILREMLPLFDGKKGSYRVWEEQLRLLRRMYRLDDNSTKVVLGSRLCGNAAEWFHSVSEHLALPVDQLLERMRAMFDQRDNRLMLRREFEGRVWQTSETFTEYFHQKLILANKVPINEEEIIDYIIEGIPVQSIRRQAMMQQFVDKGAMLRAMENVSLYADSKSSHRVEKPSNIKNVNKVPGVVKKDDNDVISKQLQKCFNCNVAGHIAANCRHPKRETGACFRCLQPGHRATQCTAKENTPKNDSAGKSDVNSVFEREDNFLRSVSYQLCNQERQSEIECKLDTLLDTGSPVSFIKDNFVPTNLTGPMLPGDTKYGGLNGSILRAKGRVEVKVALNNKESKYVSLLVVPSTTMIASVVIGRDILRQFYEKSNVTNKGIENEIIQEIMNINVEDWKQKPEDVLDVNLELPVETQSALKALYTKEYIESQESDISATKAELKLELRELKSFHFAPRRLAYAEKNDLQALLDSLMQRQIIRPSTSEYASPIVLIRKKTGDLRLCVDFRELNKMLIRDNYPLPHIEDLINSLQGKRYFTTLDLKNGFYHIYMAEDSIKYTAFTTPLGQFEFLRMPFGLKVAPSRFQRYVNQILADFIRKSEVAVYMDDILVSSYTIEQHFEILRKIFRLLVVNHLEIRIDKCKFLYTRIEFLGYVISENGISPTKAGIDSVQRIPVPRSLKELHSFVALCSYFRKFICSFSIIAKPLYDLLRKNVPFLFGEKEMNAFEALKESLIKTPVLAIYNPISETELHCDASTAGFGAVLLQRKNDGQFHPVFFFSKRTTSVEARYHSFELEMLAIIYALRRFKIYLCGIKFKIITDCNALTLALKKRDVNPRIERWVLELLSYDYVTEHRSSTRMGHVDALSRPYSDVLIIEDNSFDLNLVLRQSGDEKLRALREELQKTDDACFEMRNGVIYRKHKQDLLFYVPRAMEMHVIHRYHDQLGHLGIEKTVETMLKSYWFPSMRQKVGNYIANCLKCISFSPSVGKAEGYLHNIPKGQLPFIMYHVDHFGPIDKKCSIKQYILVVVDSFTKFTKLYPTKTTATSEVLKSLTAHFCNYSRPKIIVSDRGTAFTSDEFETYCSDNDIQHILIATNSPKANGQVERINRVLKPMISKLIDNDDKLYWYKIIADVEFSLNNTIHATTGETPSKLLFGVDQRGKIIDKIREYLDTTINSDRDVIRLRARAADNIIKSQKYNKKYFDRKRKPAHIYKTGDRIMIKNIDSTIGASRKIIPEFKGPYEVTRVLRNDRYVVRDIEGHQVTRRPYEGTWEAANMRPWTSDEIVAHDKN